MSPSLSTAARSLGKNASEDVVEIGLLLPASWAEALMEMSRKQRVSVGQLLRNMIDRALVDDLANDF